MRLPWRILASCVVVLWALCALGAAGATAKVEHQWQAQSLSGAVRATLAPRNGPPQLGRYQAWTLQLTSRNGAGLSDATPRLNGGMRAHGHGLPSRPAVTATDIAGGYLIEGLKLNMAGDWLLVVDFRHDGATDRVMFELQIPQAPRLSDREHAVFATLTLDALPALPASPGNRVADDPLAAALGEQIFFDPGFSGTGEISCATCHLPQRQFTDGRVTALGVGRTSRNTPTLIASAYLEWFYWDGRRDSLWSQALIPFEAAAEMGSSRTAVVRRVATDPSLRAGYRAVFGELPNREWLSALRPAGPLGDRGLQARWRSYTSRERVLVDTVFANIGKAIAAYERTLLPKPTRFDRFVASRGTEKTVQLSASELAGARLFIDAERTQCLQCHNGPLLTNGGFHNIGTGNFSGANLDFGRAMGVRAVLLDPFNCYGDYSDAEPTQCRALRFLNTDAHVPLEGAFKTPSLRELGHTAPYFHDGSKATLEAVLEHYREPPAQGAHELRALPLTDAELADIVAFLGTLNTPAPQ